MRPRATSSYFQPRFLSKSQGAGNGSQEFLGMKYYGYKGGKHRAKGEEHGKGGDKVFFSAGHIF